MSRPKVDAILDFDNGAIKADVLRKLGTYRGQYKVKVLPTRPQRSSNQNRWYHAAIVQPFAEFLTDNGYEVIGHDEAHEIIKAKFLRVDVCDPGTGEVVAERVRSTTDLSTEEFSDYCERARAWLLDMFGIHTEDPSYFHAAAACGVGGRAPGASAASGVTA